MKRVAATLIFVELVLGACSAPALQSPMPTPPPDVPLRVESVVTPGPTTPAYYYVAADGSYVAITPMPTQPSPTSLPTLIPSTTPTPRPTSSVSAYPIDLNNLPATNHDLLFLSGANLFFWDHALRKTELLIGPLAGDGSTPPMSIQNYEVSHDGVFVALVYTDQDNAQHIGAFNLKTRTLLPLHTLTSAPPPGSETMRWLHVSTDGSEIAFVDWDSTRVVSATIAGALANNPSSFPINIVLVDGTGALREAGVCAQVQIEDVLRSCIGLQWSRDGHSLAWVDAFGLWVKEATQVPRLLVRNSDSVFARPDPMRVVGRMIDWSPDSRFILYETHFYEGSAQTIVDVSTGALVDLPGTMTYGQLGASAYWLRDGRFLLLGPDYNPPQMEYARSSNGVWAIRTSPILAIAQEMVIELELSPNNVPVAPFETSDDEIRFAVLNADPSDDRSRGVYALSLKNGAMRKLADLPDATFKNAPREFDEQPITGNVVIVWSPDGETLVYVDDARNLMIRAADMPLYDLRPLAQGGGPAIQFAWLP